MATCVTSDAHGHVRALDRALELAGPGSGDVVYVLGDMVDRGPDPVGVLRLVRSLPNARVLMGNHERMLLDTLMSEDEREVFIWEMNGGSTTARGLDSLASDEAADLIDWIAQLPLFDVVEVDDRRPGAAARAGVLGCDARRTYLLSHAGIDALAARAYLAMAGTAGSTGTFADAAGSSAVSGADVATLRDMMASQSADDLLWIRSEFWGAPTGLVGPDGRGPVVVAGHTPSILLRRYATLMGGTGAHEGMYGCMVEVGATASTFGEADRICVDCAAATGYPSGRVGVMRLEDRRVWYAEVREGE